MFCDLSIIYQPDVTLMAKILNRAKAAGYDVVAINHVVKSLKPDHQNPIPELLKEISKLETNRLASASSVSDPLADIVDSKQSGSLPPNLGTGRIISRGWSGLGGLKVLSRLTLQTGDVTFGQVLNTYFNVTKQYDIVAVQLKGWQPLTQGFQKLDIDLIALDLTKPLYKPLQHCTVQPARERGIYFEIPYAPAIQEPVSRRHLFYNATNLIRALQGTNVIFTSCTTTALDIRGPYDVANLGTLFGINQAMAKQMVTSAPLSLITKAETRKYTEKAVVAAVDNHTAAGYSTSKYTHSTKRGAEDSSNNSNPFKKPKPELS